jgi:hypothetical protein
MKRSLVYLPLLAAATLCALLVARGPIAQFSGYHAFADQSVLFGVPHGADVLSNIGFALVALWGLLRLWPMHGPGRHGYRLFLMALLMTAAGSALYHLAPGDARLVWDRIPIALACAGLMTAVRAECLQKCSSLADSVLLGIFAVLSVLWWYVTGPGGTGDLRPYLLMQGLPLVLIPLWQFIYGAPRRDKLAFGIALALYVFAKLAELSDHALLDALGVVSGHTIKHLLATAAAAVLVARLVERQRAPRSQELREVTA